MAVFPTGAIHKPVNNYVWDVGTLAWVVETQPSGGGGGGGASTIADGADVAEGATTDAAVITDTAGTVSGKLRGLVKWAFERMPASLGQKTMAASLPVVLASDQSSVPVTLSTDGVFATGTLTNNGDTLAINTKGMGALSIWQPAVAGGWDGTLTLEGTNDATNWFTVRLARQDDGQVITTFSNTAFVLRANVAGFTQFRLTVSGRTAGNTTITLFASPSSYQSYIASSIFDQVTSNHLTIGPNGEAYVNVAKVSGNLTEVNIGIASNGTQRVVLASDQPTVPVSAASLPLPTGAATAARQDTGNTSLASIDGKLTAPLSVTGPLTDAQLRASAVAVTGSFSASTAADVVDTQALEVYTVGQTAKNLTQDQNGRLRIAEDPLVNYQLSLLVEILAVLRAMHLQSAMMVDHSVDPGEFLTDRIN